jgi:hypothetical protein
MKSLLAICIVVPVALCDKMHIKMSDRQHGAVVALLDNERLSSNDRFSTSGRMVVSMS